eukprot:1930431-Amphidinium_carterae.1
MVDDSLCTFALSLLAMFVTRTEALPDAAAPTAASPLAELLVCYAGAPLSLQHRSLCCKHHVCVRVSSTIAPKNTTERLVIYWGLLSSL